jgi:hypothetical protein
MAKLSAQTEPPPRAPFARRLEKHMEEQLAKAGLDADVIVEAVPSTKLHRVYVIAKEFEHLTHSERQDLVWRLANEVLTPDEGILISIIYTLLPVDFEDLIPPRRRRSRR